MEARHHARPQELSQTPEPADVRVAIKEVIDRAGVAHHVNRRANLGGEQCDRVAFAAHQPAHGGIDAPSEHRKVLDLQEAESQRRLQRVSQVPLKSLITRVPGVMTVAIPYQKHTAGE